MHVEILIIYFSISWFLRALKCEIWPRLFVVLIRTLYWMQMRLVFEEAEKKNKTLASWTKERVEQVSRMAAMWDNFQTVLDNHQYILSKQVCIEFINLYTYNCLQSFKFHINKSNMKYHYPILVPFT